MDLQLDGKVALVTAASKGIGRAVAQRLAAEGATVVLSSRDKEALAEAVNTAGDVRGRLLPLPCDLSDPEATAGLVPAIVADHGQLDILVANTPGPKIVSFLQASLADWSSAYDTLARPVLQLARAAAERMVDRGEGSIVFMTSTWVKQPAPGGVLSAGIRSLISSVSKQMSLELAPQGVRVNQIMPGATGTDRMRNITVSKAEANGTTADHEVEKVVRDIPLGRWADPEEIARYVAFMASPASSFATGAAVALDGGAVRSTL